jgi:chaperonin GroEL (HSP60 family)
MLNRRKSAVSGKAKLGVEAFANAMLTIPKTLAENRFKCDAVILVGI